MYEQMVLMRSMVVFLADCGNGLVYAVDFLCVSEHMKLVMYLHWVGFGVEITSDNGYFVSDRVQKRDLDQWCGVELGLRDVKR